MFSNIIFKKLNIKNSPKIYQRFIGNTSSYYSKKDDCCAKEDPFNVPPRNPFDEKHEDGGYLIPKILSLMVGIPAVALFSLYLFLFREKPERPPFIPYSYLRIRTKKFPWGDGNHSLLHNPRVNALPDGYETEP
ncbi:hypothetical protein O3M35_007785 [Rhynocoris fuscipes]|uniref:Cytochrome c oxidase subunit n=1 Tax=Rhynocoris fuscipes TaxID=488301 RepID=A0AAW1DFT8_9HEMI